MEIKVFSAELSHLYGMLDFVRNYALSLGMPPGCLDQVVLAMEEALVNVINYGYPDRGKGELQIVCEGVSNPNGLKISILDQGIPFNPIANIPANPSSTPPVHSSDRALGGYGIYILAGLMDQVEYQRTEEGNILALTKYFCSSKTQVM